MKLHYDEIEGDHYYKDRKGKIACRHRCWRQQVGSSAALAPALPYNSDQHAMHARGSFYIRKAVKHCLESGNTPQLQIELLNRQYCFIFYNNLILRFVTRMAIYEIAPKSSLAEPTGIRELSTKSYRVDCGVLSLCLRDWRLFFVEFGGFCYICCVVSRSIQCNHCSIELQYHRYGVVATRT